MIVITTISGKMQVSFDGVIVDTKRFVVASGQSVFMQLQWQWVLMGKMVRRCVEVQHVKCHVT